MPYIYYQGYNAVGDNNQKFDILESNQGFIEIKVPKGYVGNIRVEYKGTTMYYVSMVISMFGACAFVIYIIIKEKYYRKNKELRRW